MEKPEPATGGGDIAAVRKFLRDRDGLRAVEILPWLAAVAFPLAFPNQALLGTQVLVTALFVLSLDLLIGYAGIVTLGHAVYFGVGAYTAGLLSARLGWSEPISAMLASGAAAGLLGIASGALLIRYAHLAFIMLTLVLVMMAYELANAWTSLTGGWDGLMGIQFSPVLGVFDWDLRGVTSYGFALAFLGAAFLGLRFPNGTPFMQGLLGVKHNRLRMMAIGARVSRQLIAAFALSAALAGIAGGLFAVSNAFVTIDVLGFDRSAAALTVLILGGVGRLYGALLGALTFVVASHWLARLSPIYWELGIGLILVVVVLLCPNGLLGLIDDARVALRRRIG